MFTRERVISYYITTTLFTTTFHVGTIHINDNLPRVSSISATFHIVRLGEQSKALLILRPRSRVHPSLFHLVHTSPVRARAENQNQFDL